MRRLAAFLFLALAFAPPALAMKLERVVLIERHGVRPPTSSNAELAKYSDQPWPAWPVAAGELTAHGEATVRLMGDTLRDAYLAHGLLPAAGCPPPGEVAVWADGADQRTRRTGEVLAAALAPGCGLKAGWAAPAPRDPIFGSASEPACRVDEETGRIALARAAGAGGLETPAVRAALVRLQRILAPRACDGGAGTCLAGANASLASPAGPKGQGPMFVASSLAEDLLLEYAEGMAPADVGWGRAGGEAGIAAVMAPHERVFGLIRSNPTFSAGYGAAMARVVLAALAGERGPHSGPQVRLLALAGHDTNLAVMGGILGLSWTLPGEPDATSPAQTLALEVWSDHGRPFLRPVMWYETLGQLRALSPARARSVALRIPGCDDGPMGGCPLGELRRRVLAEIPPGCGEAQAAGAARAG